MMTTSNDEQGTPKLRDFDIDSVFSYCVLSDTALDASYRATARFSSDFPGWELYRKVVSGDTLFDKKIIEWAISSAKMLADSRKLNGREYVSALAKRKGDWVQQAALDALDMAIHGKFAVTATARVEAFNGLPVKTYRAIRDPVAKAIIAGLEMYRNCIHAEYWNVRRDEKMVRSVTLL